MNRETLLKLVFIDVVLAFDIFMIWYSVTFSTILPVVFASLGAMLFWPKFMANLSFTSLQRRQWVWLIIAVDTTILGLVFIILSQIYVLVFFYLGTSLLILILRRSEILTYNFSIRGVLA